MFDSTLVFAVICIYMGILFFIAMGVERGARAGRNLSDNPVVYSLSMAVYCTAWTYYGSVGTAANSGMLFLTIYLGPTLAAIFWLVVLRKLVRLKNTHRITSIADFISSRYGKSQSLGAMATLLALAGITPYIALQLKAVISTFGIITSGAGAPSKWVGPWIVGLMVLFTIVFGVRRIDPTERHPGMVMAVAVESVVKLAAFLAAGIFVTFFLFDGFGDVLDTFAQSRFNPLMVTGNSRESSFSTWVSYLVLAMSAILFLPRQFHVGVVENFKASHIRTAMWLFPLYLLLINVFVVPIAMGGLLAGYPAAGADTFVLQLPQASGARWLSLMVFVGGFSAATSMVMISAMTLATMVTNHLLMPLIQWVPRFGFLRRYLLQCRWAALTAGIVIGYCFAETVGETALLVNMGILSFAAALQFAPAILGGLFWHRGSKAGAQMGLGAGFFLWGYTMLLPAVVKSGWLPQALLTQGPGGMAFLAPEALFGMTAWDPVVNTVFWSLLINTGGYLVGSYLFAGSDEERRLAREFTGARGPDRSGRPPSASEPAVDLAEKASMIEMILRQYFPARRADRMMMSCLRSTGIEEQQRISIIELADLYGAVEKMLAGSLGAAAAHRAMKQAAIFTKSETEALSAVYADLLASIRVPPSELKEKVDYYRERETLLVSQAEEMARKVRAMENEITERKKVEAALQESQEKFRGIFDQTFQFAGLLDTNGAVLEANQTALALIGAAESQVKGRLFWETPWWRHSSEVQIRLKEAVQQAAQGHLVRYETTNCDSAGNLINIDFSLKPVRNQFGRVTFIIPESRDITDRKKAEEALRENERRLTAILEANPDPVVVFDRKGRALFINPAFTRLFGWQISDLEDGQLPHVPRELRHQFEDNIRNILKGNRTANFESKRLTKAGTVLTVAVSAAAIRDESGEIARIVVNLTDITAFKRLETQLRQAHKMEAMGTLAGGIAHDFNNILGAVLGYTELAMYKSRDGKDNRQDLEKVLAAGERAKNLVSQILSFSRQSDHERKPVQIVPILTEALTLLRASIPANIEIRTDLPDNLANVSADATQIHQVLMNLCTNAAHAMGETGGILGVSVKSVFLGESDVVRHADLVPGPSQRLTVSDTGYGMDPVTMERIFDPFFTTKGRGEGSGMGLSVVHGIVKSHGGAVLVYSEPGKGTTFNLFFPELDERAREQPTPERAQPLPGGKERILFVDDEEPLVDIGRQILEPLGYGVTCRTSSTQALELFRSGPDRFDLVITDQTMPRMTGVQLAREILMIRPDIPVILCTGFSSLVTPDTVQALGIRRLITKPLLVREMAEAVRSVLDREA